MAEKLLSRVLLGVCVLSAFTTVAVEYITRDTVRALHKQTCESQRFAVGVEPHVATTWQRRTASPSFSISLQHTTKKQVINIKFTFKIRMFSFQTYKMLKIVMFLKFPEFEIPSSLKNLKPAKIDL